MREYWYMDENELGKDAKIPLVKLGDSGEVFYEMALDMVRTIQNNNKENKKTVFICPVGPVGQYPIFVRLVNTYQVDLKNCWFINMDEYLDDEKEWIPKEDLLSFRGFMEREVYSKINHNLVMPQNQRIFPNPNNLSYIDEIITQLGGVDVCYGGIGINGHLAFNESEPTYSIEEFSELKTRVLPISKETRVMNSVGEFSGAIELMPKYCVTIGMKNILNAKRIVLACFRDWHRAVVRHACYGEVSASFPVTLVQNHNNAKILINSNVAKSIR